MPEMGMGDKLVELPFPFRIFDKPFLVINMLGTKPYFESGDINMTESLGISQYLVETIWSKKVYPDLGLRVDPPEFSDHLNCLFQSDATLTFSYTLLESEECRRRPAIKDYGK